MSTKLSILQIVFRSSECTETSSSSRGSFNSLDCIPSTANDTQTSTDYMLSILQIVFTYEALTKQRLDEWTLSILQIVFRLVIALTPLRELIKPFNSLDCILLTKAIVYIISKIMLSILQIVFSSYFLKVAVPLHNLINFQFFRLYSLIVVHQ